MAITALISSVPAPGTVWVPAMPGPIWRRHQSRTRLSCATRTAQVPGWPARTQVAIGVPASRPSRRASRWFMDRSIPRKSLGQHWLQDPASLQAMVDAADLQEDDTVLEIGSGPGTLTALLTDKADKVVAVELDEKLANELPSRIKAQNLEVVNEDILRFDLTRLPADYK